MEVLEDELICAVCRDIFVEPLTLPCGHNYCESCVNQLKRASDREDEFASLIQYYTCPLCLAPCDTKINLKKNVVLYNIIEKYHTSRASCIDCSVCKGEQRLAAEKSCVNCNESYCTIHIMPHYENSTLLQHVLVNPIGDTCRLCIEHGKELELFCETDSTPLCVYCMLPSEAKHGDGHSVVKLADSWNILRKKCQVQLEGITQSLAEVKDGLTKMDEEASHSEDSLLSQQRQYTDFLSRVKLFLDFEENAWQKRFSVDLVQTRRSRKHRSEKLKRLEQRLSQTQRTLLEAQNIRDPLVLLQLLQNADWADLFERSTCSSQIQELRTWSTLQPVPSAITPLFKTLHNVFPGDHIFFHKPTAHPRLKFSPDNTAVWMTEEQEEDHARFPNRPFCVLGRTVLSKGVHHWEVEVNGLPSWAVGIAYLGPQQSTVQKQLGRDCNSWSLSYNQSKQQFCSQHDWLTFSFTAAEKPSQIGIFLDIDSGILCFYDAVRWVTLYTFYCRLDQPSEQLLYPAFCPRLMEDESPVSTQTMRVLH
ncbi:E3 ubiquitin-protein ligase TRIM41-like [Hypomesus transpacificus]|uniref:E3 ubiquitin-protein ligase TRIM41-like n=1 Tax=Hypomesus transpacificus TaxID=137520 RepID=UPI001F0877F6|nr:E3 ubiquitin-protein ligase TRIM41-like [Hypomesus transpacificus]